MDCLSKRQLDFIRLMLEEEDYKPISYFSGKIDVSSKTLKKDLNILRNYLCKYGVEILGKTGKGILITPDAKKNIYIMNDLSFSMKEVKKESLEARRATILKNLLVYSNTYTSIQKLSEEYYVSKTSIVNDMKYIEKWLFQYNLILEKTKQGTRIQGKETDIRKAIAALIQIHKGEKKEAYMDAEFNGFLKVNESTLNGLRELFELEDIIYVESLLSNLESKSNVSISDIYYINLLTHILICIRRVTEGIHIEESNIGKMILTDTLDQYQQALHITNMINERYQINIGECETYYIYQYLVSSRLDEKNEVEEKIKDADEGDISCKVAELLTEYMSDILEVDFREEKELLSGLLLHIRPMLNRMKYNIQISNPLLKEMQNEYSQLLGICELVFGIFCKKFGFKKVRIDEVAYITIYYQTMILKLKKPIRVLVVCHSGYGTSQLLAAKLMKEFSNLVIIDVVSFRRLEVMKLEDVDYVISTVPISLKKVPHIVISALLTEKDIQNIRKSLKIPRKHKKNGQYIKFLDKYLNEEIEISDNKVIYQASLLPSLSICLVEEEKEKFYVRMNIFKDEAGVKRVKFFISNNNPEMMKKILSEIYALSVNLEDFDKFIKSRNEKEAVKFLRERKYSDEY